MPSSTESKEQDVQTDDWTQEKCVNTNESWEHLMRGLVEQSAELAAEHESLEKQLVAEDTESKSQIKGLEKMKDDKQRQHRALLDKIDSVRVKLDLNSSKTTRKNFTAKVEELTSERDQKLEVKKRLTQELEEVDGKLKILREEKRIEKLTCEQEIAALQQELERLSQQVEESNWAARKDEIAALESERELAISQREDWIAEAERYLNTLRSDTSPQSSRHRIEWERNVVMVQNSLSKIQLLYNENLKQLHKGQQLDSLPKIPLPPLPHIPMIDLLNFASYAAIRPPVTQPQFHSAHRATPPLPPAQNPAAFKPHVLEQNVPVPRLAVPTAIHAPGLPYTHPTYTLPYAAVPPAQVSIPVSLAVGGPSQGAGPMPSVRNPASQALPHNPQPAGKLDKLLEILGAQFPQCTRTQIMAVLQQVKSERGTMAGMSIEDIRQQVEQRLAQNERPAAPSARKLCLMCQYHVEPGTQYNTNCLHVLHKECISVWLQSSKNNSCPFCPSK
ncbi:RING finger protein 214 isoform X2 [Neoarius graeffei]|uniref:RING finger protein 214 isoform X2 n=1 Tax=Neoarius graeffei TaxID=443677 RepID=UPI00298D10AA|nr:RING finger protein 214 isoform X2 [Neoarius graeffei]